MWETEGYLDNGIEGSEGLAISYEYSQDATKGFSAFVFASSNVWS